jgi:hypothetical protein
MKAFEYDKHSGTARPWAQTRRSCRIGIDAGQRETLEPTPTLSMLIAHQRIALWHSSSQGAAAAFRPAGSPGADAANSVSGVGSE